MQNQHVSRLNNHTIPQLVQEVQAQLSGGRLQRHNFAQAAAKEFHEQTRLLSDKVRCCVCFLSLAASRGAVQP